MKFWNGAYKIEESDKCNVCLYPSTCAMINMMVQHSKDVAMWSDKPIGHVIYECPCREIEK